MVILYVRKEHISLHVYTLSTEAIAHFIQHVSVVKWLDIRSMCALKNIISQQFEDKKDSSICILSCDSTTVLLGGDLHREGHCILEEFEATCVVAIPSERGPEEEYVPEEGKRDARWEDTS